ncbi:MAG: hypothetical protein R6V73_03210 [Anaerolineales bacterium]|jgi:hypothetical protein
MPSIEYDLNYLQAGLEDLEGYLLSKELYWAIDASAPTGETPYPRMTLGNLFLARARLSDRRLSTAERVQLDHLNKRIQDVRQQWLVAWGKKSVREFSARLRLWRDFLEEYRKNPTENLDRYAYEVTRRVVLDLLYAEAEEIPAEEVELLAGLNELLRAVFKPGRFIWNDKLKSSFPESTYWYLYGTLKEEL